MSASSGSRTAVIDIHAHYVNPSVIDAVRKSPETYGVRIEGRGNRKWFSFNGKNSRPFFRKMTDLNLRMVHMNDTGVDIEVLSTWVDLFGYELPRAQSVAFCSVINDGLQKAVLRGKGRFRAIATLPLPHAKEAADVLEESVTEMGFAGAMIGTNVLEMNLDESFLEPLWTKAERLDVPIVLHPTMPKFGSRLSSHYLENLVGNPLDTTIAATSLIFGGVLDRHPRLKIVLLHGGGYLPYGFGRLDHGFDVRQECGTAAGNHPSHYLRKFYYDTVIYDKNALKYLAGIAGRRNLLLGTDCPFDMELPDPVAFVKTALPFHESVLHSNAERLFKLKSNG
ncbi:MAG: amidohydrolase family protein [Methanomassiliicoccales archaeon]|nr:amidohydrolase family protein [Methanomassiliicoccales archaeon]